MGGGSFNITSACISFPQDRHSVPIFRIFSQARSWGGGILSETKKKKIKKLKELETKNDIRRNKGEKICIKSIFCEKNYFLFKLKEN